MDNAISNLEAARVVEELNSDSSTVSSNLTAPSQMRLDPPQLGTGIPFQDWVLPPRYQQHDFDFPNYDPSHLAGPSLGRMLPPDPRGNIKSEHRVLALGIIGAGIMTVAMPLVYSVYGTLSLAVFPASVSDFLLVATLTVLGSGIIFVGVLRLTRQVEGPWIPKEPLGILPMTSPIVKSEAQNW